MTCQRMGRTSGCIRKQALQPRRALRPKDCERSNITSFFVKTLSCHKMWSVLLLLGLVMDWFTRKPLRAAVMK